MELIIESWKSMQWEPLQKKVDEEVTAIGQRQDDDETCRIRLLDESNAYRKATTKETRKVAVPLIKAFQSEVDRLTKRGKTTEGALIDICSRLTNIPDPLPILLKASQWKVEAEKAKTATEEANQLRQSIADLHDEFADLKNQDVTIRQLRERIKVLENEKTNEVEQSIDDTERKVREEFAAREFEMNMRSDKLKAENQNLEKKISELEVKMRDAQRRLDSARLAADQRESFETEQIEILTRDLDSANRRVASLEAEIQRLTSDLADAQAASKRGGLEDIAAFGGLMKEKDEQIARLQAETSRLSESMKLETKTNKTKYEEMAKEIQHQKSLMAEMEVKLRDQKDYEEIKEQLRLLREIEFGEAATANEESIIRLGETVQSLDKLLADKNRRLQNENAQLRMSNKKLQEEKEAEESELEELRRSHQQNLELIGKLEKDLAATVSGGKVYDESEEELTTLQLLETVNNEQVKHEDNSLVAIVTSQRDRFKHRVEQLEEELITEKTRYGAIQAELDKLKEDNVKLYGKIKYLQCYGNKSETSVQIDTSNNYKEQYEKRLDPFHKFNQSEKQRTYTKLKIHDKASLSIGKAIMSSATARMTFFFYLLFMHLLVFMVLYRFAYAEACDRDFQQDCVEKFQQHMKDHHHDA